MDSPSSKDVKEGASAIAAGREFHKGTVCGLKLYLNESVENCLNFFECVDLVLVVYGIKYLSAGMSIRLCTTLKKRVSWIFDVLDFSDSHLRL